MRKIMLVGVMGFLPSLAVAGVDVNVNIGIPVPPPVVVAPAPAPPPPGAFNVAPRFIFSPTLGFYVSVGIPYDIVYYGPNYYFYSGGAWYGSPYYNGPWTRARHVPTMIRRFRYEDIRHYRDLEYREYQRDRNHYRGRWYEPVRGGHGERHEGYDDRHGGHDEGRGGHDGHHGH